MFLDWLSISVQFIGILLFLGGIFRYIVLKPLDASINLLKDTIEKMSEQENAREEKRQSMDKRLVVVEQSAKSAHHRIDHLEELVDERK